jgi:hypothetical protein
LYKFKCDKVEILSLKVHFQAIKVMKCLGDQTKKAESHLRKLDNFYNKLIIFRDYYLNKGKTFYTLNLLSEFESKEDFDKNYKLFFRKWIKKYNVTGLGCYEVNNYSEVHLHGLVCFLEEMDDCIESIVSEAERAWSWGLKIEETDDYNAHKWINYISKPISTKSLPFFSPKPLYLTKGDLTKKINLDKNLSAELSKISSNRSSQKNRECAIKAHNRFKRFGISRQGFYRIISGC